MEYKSYDEKYANLLITRCIVNNGIKPLVIIYTSNKLENFAHTCYIQAKKNGFKDVILFNKNTIGQSLDATKHILDERKLDEYAIRESNILFIKTNDYTIHETQENQELLQHYYQNLENLKCPWCVAVYPNLNWAQRIYPNLLPQKAYEKLYLNIMQICQITKQNPIKEWDTIVQRQNDIIKRLNDLRIKKLHYSNGLGTNLDLYLPDNHIWFSVNTKDYHGNSIMLNMPSYEITTSPLYSETTGIVYSSKPLYYSKTIPSFGLKFEKGAVKDIITTNRADYHLINHIIQYDDSSKYLGECALVENDNPINQTNTIYYNTLLDENSSCHLALGGSFAESIVGGLFMTNSELRNCGINISKNHVDFMIGTDDLIIEAETKKGREIIFSKGKITI